MKIRKIIVGVKSLEDNAKEVGDVMKRLMKGHSPRPHRPETNFVDYNAMRSVLTPCRMKLMKIIRNLAPGSVYELSQMAGRDLKNVQNDVALLERLGLINVSHQKTHRRRAVPTMNFDRLNMEVDFIAQAA